MRCIGIFLLATAISFVVGLVVAFWLSGPRLSGLPPEPTVTIEKIAGNDSLVLSFPEHSPYTHSSFYDVHFDYDVGDIDVGEMVMLWNPFSQHSFGRPPVVICNGLLPRTYKVRYWDGNQFVTLGTLKVEETKDRKKLVWKEKTKGENKGVGSL